MFSVYILWSDKLSRFYVGHTRDIEARLRQHNSPGAKWTSRGAPWQIVYEESFGTRAEAMNRERQIKSWKSAKSIWELIQRPQ